MKVLKSHRDLEVYQIAFKAAMEIFELTKNFPIEERYSLIDQIRRSSRSVSANISESFRKRRYPKSFVSKLSDAEAEAAETQSWLEFSLSCSYITKNDFDSLYETYDNILGKLVRMINQPDKWKI